MQSSTCGTADAPRVAIAATSSSQSRDLFMGQATRNYRIDAEGGRTSYNQGAAEREGGTHEALQAFGAALPETSRSLGVRSQTLPSQSMPVGFGWLDRVRSLFQGWGPAQLVMQAWMLPQVPNLFQEAAQAEVSAQLAGMRQERDAQRSENARQVLQGAIAPPPQPAALVLSSGLRLGSGMVGDSMVGSGLPSAPSVPPLPQVPSGPNPPSCSRRSWSRRSNVRDWGWQTEATAAELTNLTEGKTHRMRSRMHRTTRASACAAKRTSAELTGVT